MVTRVPMPMMLPALLTLEATLVRAPGITGTTGSAKGLAPFGSGSSKGLSKSINLLMLTGRLRVSSLGPLPAVEGGEGKE